MQALRRSLLITPRVVGITLGSRPLLITPRRLLSASHLPRPLTKHSTRLRRRGLLLTGAISGTIIVGIWADAKTCPDPPFQLSTNFASPRGAAATRSIPPHPSDLLPLLRAYLVYGLISIPFLVDYAPTLLDQSLRVPILGSIVKTCVRNTFFAHYVGGETVQDSLPAMHRLRSENKGVLLVYSVEVDASKASGHDRGNDSGSLRDVSSDQHKRFVDEVISSIDVAGDFEDSIARQSEGVGRTTCVAVKLTALLPRADALRNLSVHLVRTRPTLSDPVPFPGTPDSTDLSILHCWTPSREESPLTEEDIRDLRGLYGDLKRICTRAKERRVRVMIDAEYSWYQPAVDAFGHALMEQFNKLPEENGWMTQWIPRLSSKGGDVDLQPLVYATYQAYLRRTPTHLAHSLALSRKRGYALGIKLVRGAYHPHELAAHSDRSTLTASISPDPDPPVYRSKADTDACYDQCAAILVRAIAEDITSAKTTAITRPPRLAVLFGTHNWLSTELVLDALVNNGLACQGGGGGTKGVLIIPPEVAERCTFAQLYGMTDSLTDYIVDRTRSTVPCVIKYMPYGALGEVMPYLSRRAVENRSVLGNGGATRERKEAAVRIWNTLFGNVGL
ncbi:FAD-linked oxidoreductase-like protein [Scleroderma yunnanense]